MEMGQNSWEDREKGNYFRLPRSVTSAVFQKVPYQQTESIPFRRMLVGKGDEGQKATRWAHTSMTW